MMNIYKYDCYPYLEVHISNSMPDVATPVASLGAFEIGATGLAETQLRTESGPCMLDSTAFARPLVAP